VVAGRVRDPERNVTRATLLGTAACAAVYLLGTVAVFGLVSHEALVGSTAPFSDAADAIFGGGRAGDVMAVVAIISGLGCLNGWTLICAEMPMAAAKDRLFPTQFASVSHREIPVFGILVSTAAASVLTTFAYFQFQSVFTQVVLLSVLTAVVPYLYSAIAHLYWLLVKGRAVSWPHLVRDTAVSLAAVAFCFWALAGSGYQPVYYGVFALFGGLPVYVWMKTQRNEYGESPVTPIEYPAGSAYAAKAGNGHGNGHVDLTAGGHDRPMRVR
jgi:APA family basic amino acid/polyamine antiporter